MIRPMNVFLFWSDYQEEFKTSLCVKFIDVYFVFAFLHLYLMKLIYNACVHHYKKSKPCHIPAQKKTRQQKTTTLEKIVLAVDG